MKILLIEDDKFFQKFYAVKLQESKVEMEVAGNGEEGLVKMKSIKPDMVLLDLIMPKMDGFAVLKARSQDPELMKIPVVVFSTLGQEKDVMTAKSLGANGYVNKSTFDFDKLVGTLNQVLKGT
jgi:two-component system, chemotaxis family, chemotaxis protein CheY